MKKITAMVLILGMGLFVMPTLSHAASGNDQDTIIDKAGDWFATLGKSGQEKDQIISERQMDRVAKRLGQAINGESKKAGQQMDKLGKDMQKAFQS